MEREKLINAIVEATSVKIIYDACNSTSFEHEIVELVRRSLVDLRIKSIAELEGMLREVQGDGT